MKTGKEEENTESPTTRVLLFSSSFSLSLSPPHLPTLFFPFGGKHGLRRRQEPNQRGLRHRLGHGVALFRRGDASDARTQKVEASEGDDQRLERLLRFPADRADAGPVPGVGGVDGGEDEEGDEALQGDAEEPGAGDRGGEVRKRQSLSVAVVVVASLWLPRSWGGRERAEGRRGETPPPRLGRGSAGAGEEDGPERSRGGRRRRRATASSMVKLIDSRPRSRFCCCSSVGPLLSTPWALDPCREHAWS